MPRDEERGKQNQKSIEAEKAALHNLPPPHRCREWNTANDRPLDQWDRRRQRRTWLGFGLCCPSDTEIQHTCFRHVFMWLRLAAASVVLKSPLVV